MANSLEAKIVVLGSQGVGKTSLVHRYVKNAFTPPNTQSTIGASFLTKRVMDIDTSTVVRLQIWDTAGQERFRSISKLYYRGMHTIWFCSTKIRSSICTYLDILSSIAFASLHAEPNAANWRTGQVTQSAFIAQCADLEDARNRDYPAPHQIVKDVPETMQC